MAEPQDDRQPDLNDLGRLFAEAFEDALKGPIGSALVAAASGNQRGTDTETAVRDVIEQWLTTVIQGAVADAVQQALSDSADRERELAAAVEQALSDVAWEALPTRYDGDMFVINVVAPNTQGLLAGVLQVLAVNQVGVRTARGAEWRRSTAWLSIEVEARIELADWAMLYEDLTRVSGGKVTLCTETKVVDPPETVHPAGPSPTTSPRVTATNKRGAPYTTLTILAIDRLGLLAVVAGVIVQRGYDFVGVEAETHGTEASDAFDIVDRSGHQLTDVAARELEEAVLHALAPAF